MVVCTGIIWIVDCQRRAPKAWKLFEEGVSNGVWSGDGMLDFEMGGHSG